MKVVKKVVSVVLMVVAKVLRGVAMVCDYVASKAEAGSDSLAKE